jgi:hypothetical protein
MSDLVQIVLALATVVAGYLFAIRPPGWYRARVNRRRYGSAEPKIYIPAQPEKIILGALSEPAQHFHQWPNGVTVLADGFTDEHALRIVRAVRVRRASHLITCPADLKPFLVAPSYRVETWAEASRRAG